ncbi:MAG: hypothetical protein HY438_02025 [DPANN group archaeon]|nr:hypothetical protein [DPANN group archaeon]
MGDGTEGLWNHRHARIEIRKADLQLVLDILPYIYEINPQHHLLRQIAREIKQNHVTLYSEASIVAALKLVNDRVGFLARDTPYYATPADAQRDRPAAWYYICVLEQKIAQEKIVRMASQRFKTPLLTPRGQQGGTASLEDFL